MLSRGCCLAPSILILLLNLPPSALGSCQGRKSAVSSSLDVHAAAALVRCEKQPIPSCSVVLILEIGCWNDKH